MRSTLDADPKPLDVAGASLTRQILGVGIAPERRDPARHSHGGENFGVAAAGLGERLAGHGEGGRGPGRIARHGFGHHGDDAENDGAEQGSKPDVGMESKADHEIDRQPRQVEQRVRTRTRQEGANAVEIAQRLESVVAVAHLQRQAHDRLIDSAAQRLVEAPANSHQNAAADQIEQALRGVETAGQDQEPDERRYAAARQYAVVNLQHEERAGEHQNIAHAGHQADRNERPAASRECFCELGALLGSTAGLPHQD